MVQTSLLKSNRKQMAPQGRRDTAIEALDRDDEVGGKGVLNTGFVRLQVGV